MSTTTPSQPPADGVGRFDWERRATARTGAGLRVELDATFTRLRSEAPVHRTGIPALFGAPDPLAAIFGDRPHVSTMTYAATEEALTDPTRFSNAGLKSMSERAYGPVSLQASDGPEHRRYRMLVQPAFARRGLAMWQRWLRPHLDELIDGFVAQGSGNLYFDYCAQFPAYITSKAFGVPDGDVEMFSRWAALLQTGAVEPEEADAVSAEVVQYMGDIISARRLAPEDDLISLLVTSTMTDDEGTHAPSDEQILGLVRNIMPAGVGTTYRTLGLVLMTLLARPELLERLRRDPSLAAAIVDETLRWSPPVTWMLRVATRDCDLHGYPVTEGTVVHACLAAANRDPAVFADPDAFDPDRPARQNLSFSIGPHYCIGAQVARMEVGEALLRLVERLPGLRPDPEHEAAHTVGLMFRMPSAVWARWD